MGSVIKREVDLNKFGRKSASKFKQTLLSGLKELEREEAFNFFSEKIGEIINAKIINNANGFITFAIGKNSEATMPETEGLPGEEFIIGESKKVYITKVEKTTKDQRCS